MKIMYKITVNKNVRGFTLVELLLVLTILGILASLVVPHIANRSEQARTTAALAQITVFGNALDAFEIDNGYHPLGKEGLNALLTAPKDAKRWNGPYLKGNLIPLDPWGHPYVYEAPGRNNPSGYDLSSLGQDGQAGTDDDIGNWMAAK